MTKGPCAMRGLLRGPLVLTRSARPAGNPRRCRGSALRRSYWTAAGAPAYASADLTSTGGSRERQTPLRGRCGGRVSGPPQDSTSCLRWSAIGGEASRGVRGFDPAARPLYASRKDIPSASSCAFWWAGTGVWNRPGMYQRKARPKVFRWQMHPGGQPQRRPLGFWRR